MGIIIDTATEYGRGIVSGFQRAATEFGWITLMAHPDSMRIDTGEWDAHALVLPGGVVDRIPDWLRKIPVIIAVGEGAAIGRRVLPHVIVDEKRIGELAAEYLLSRSLRNFGAAGFSQVRFSNERIAAFREVILRSGGSYFGDLDHLNPDESTPESWRPTRANIERALRGFPKPFGMFAACDSWAAMTLRSTKTAGIRVPEELQLLGVDNDTFICEVNHPTLSSVAVSWQQVGYEAAALARDHFNGNTRQTHRVIEPTCVVPRRSTDFVAIDDPDVQLAMTLIQRDAAKGVGVGDVAREIDCSRRSLERRFKALVGKTMGDELLHQRVEAARRLILNTGLSMSEVAARSGFSSQVKLAVAVRRTLGCRPTDLRKRL